MLKYIKLRLTFQTVTELVLTEYKGSTLRGLFKTALRHICCPVSDWQCDRCKLADQCVYTVITDHRTASGENTVLPYAMASSELKTDSWPPGAMLVFDLILFGSAVRFFPQVVYSMTQWEKMNVH